MPTCDRVECFKTRTGHIITSVIKKFVEFVCISKAISCRQWIFLKVNMNMQCTGCSISHARVLRCSKPTNLLENGTKFGIKKTADTSSFLCIFCFVWCVFKKNQSSNFFSFLCVFAGFFLVFISCCVKVKCRFPALTQTRKVHYNEIFAAVLHFFNDLRGIEFKISFIPICLPPASTHFWWVCAQNTEKPDCTCPRLSRFEKPVLVFVLEVERSF